MCNHCCKYWSTPCPMCEDYYYEEEIEECPEGDYSNERSHKDRKNTE